MSLASEHSVVVSHRKMRPRAKLPSIDVLADLSRAQVKLLERRLSDPIECIFDARFQNPNAEREFARPIDEIVRHKPPAAGRNDDSGLDLLSTSTTRLPPGAEVQLFLRYNYCRYRVMRVLRDFRGADLSAEAVRELLEWENEVLLTRAEIVRNNMPLVLAMAKRTKITGVDHSELISEGNLALLRSVDKFDCARGYKFSTYACRAILKSFSRVAVRTTRYRGYFPTEFDPTLEKSDMVDIKRDRVELDCVDQLKGILNGNTTHLSSVEQQVIRARFALDEEPIPGEPTRAKTLEQVGELIGVTKERVRQIQNKALEKLRAALEHSVLAV